MAQNARLAGCGKVLVLGATGMLGHTVLRLLSRSPEFSVAGTARSVASGALLPPDLVPLLITGVDVESHDALVSLFGSVRPQVVINCVGVVKQLATADDPLTALPINSLLPHRLARLCKLCGARLIHVSTDCVFAGTKGMYLESDPPDARDLYGRSKLLGEVEGDAVTLRTSIIGPELASAHGLLGWFLAQSGRIKGFTRAIFSGMPTVELARVMRDFVLPNSSLRGLFHVSADPISKYDLLRLCAAAYGRSIDIEPDGSLVIDRSLDSGRFRDLTGYRPPPWPQLVRDMREFG
jgi:dTDP-4-dehydrorhamnose reductase